MNAGQIIGTMNGQQVVGLDIAKQVFQMHTVNMGTGEIVNVRVLRAKVLEHFTNLTPCLVAIEALAMQQPGVKFVGTKSAAQQATLKRKAVMLGALPTARSALIRQRARHDRAGGGQCYSRWLHVICAGGRKNLGNSDRHIRESTTLEDAF